MPVTHRKVSTVPDVGNATLVQPQSDWNDTHSVANTVNTYTTSQGLAWGTQESVYGVAGASAITITLPTAVGHSGERFRLKRLNSTAGNVILATTSSQTIDGAATKTLTAQYQWIEVESDGANWEIFAQSSTGGGGTPGGSDTQIQYNDAGTFAGSDLTSDGSDGILGAPATVGGNIGGRVHIVGGLGKTTGAGGQVRIEGGQGDGSDDAAGGAIYVLAAAGTGVNNGLQPGGAADVIGGLGAYAGSGGAVRLLGGESGNQNGSGGEARVAGGNANGGSGTGKGGDVLIYSGSAAGTGKQGIVALSGALGLGAGNSFTNGDATPDVGGDCFFTVTNTGATTITSFDGGITDGSSNGRRQVITLLFFDANTTINNSGNIKLAGGTFTSSINATISFVFVKKTVATTGNFWFELHRSANS